MIVKVKTECDDPFIAALYFLSLSFAKSYDVASSHVFRNLLGYMYVE